MAKEIYSLPNGGVQRLWREAPRNNPTLATALATKIAHHLGDGHSGFSNHAQHSAIVRLRMFAG